MSSSDTLLCLKCRRTGHMVRDCALQTWQPLSNWIFSQERKFIKFPNGPESTEQTICHRCEELKILQLLQGEIPWRTKDELEAAARTDHPGIRKLGRTGSVQFQSNCSVCRCLWAMTPSPSSSNQEILLFPDWTINRLSGALGSHMEREEKRQYAKCILVGLEPDVNAGGLWERANSNDALCILGDNGHNSSPLSGRRILPGAFNEIIVEEWIAGCSRLHGDLCHPVSTPELKGIRLIDIESGKIVQYSQSTYKYAALSYVWGGVNQKSKPLGVELGHVPATIEDAMKFVRKLGMKYLWVDSLCIEQDDEAQKLDQIGRMWSIYRGATLTVIVLSGISANTGFPRIRKDGHIQPQLTCSIEGIDLVGLMPTLEHQIWQAPWGKRAWTLQEAILSPRCLYISDHQLYFECEAMQCCESLDQRESWAHNLNRNNAIDKARWQSWVMDETGSGCLRNPLDSPEGRFMHWGAKVVLYCYRSMTNDEDALKAFNGILQRLKTMYTKGFFWGLPIEDLQWGLLWIARTPPSRRFNFPTWSWAGWKGAVWVTVPQDQSNTRMHPVPFQVWTVVGGLLTQLLDIDFRNARDNHRESFASIDPLRTLADVAEHEASLLLVQADYEKAEELGYLVIEAVSLTIELDFSNPRSGNRRTGSRIFDIAIKGVSCPLIIMSSDPLLTDHKAANTNLSFLLLARNVGQIQGHISHYILVVSTKEGLSERKSVLQLIIAEDNIDVLSALKPQKQKFILV